MTIDWTECPSVICRPGYLAGAPALRQDPRVPPETIIDNIDAGETPQDVIENYSLCTPLRDVLAIYAYARHQREADPA